MKEFLRATRLVLSYPFTLGAAIGCSLLVAVLWGGNIGAVYPILEITFRGKPLQLWLDEEIQAGQQQCAQLRQSIRQLEDRARQLPAAQRDALHQKAESQSARLHAELQSVKLKQRLAPWADAYLPRDPFQTVAVIVLALLVATAVKDGCLLLNVSLVGYLSQLVTFRLRQQYHAHVLAMDPATFDRRGTSVLATLCDQGIEGIGCGIRGLFGNAVREPLKMIACLVGAAVISWRLLLFASVLAPVAVLLIRLLAVRIRRECSAVLQDDLMLNGVLLESYTGLRTIQASTMEPREQLRFRRVCRDRMRKSVRIVVWGALAKPVTELVGIAAIGTAILAGAYLVLNQETHLLGLRMCDRPLTFPPLLVFYGMLVGMTDPARKMSDVFGTVQLGASAAERVYAVLDQPVLVKDPPCCVPLPTRHRRLVFDRVSFHYTPQQPVLREISFSVDFGETLAIVGSNGCGKSTLGNLIPRFYDPVEGSIRLDDVDLRQASLKDLRRRIAIVAQQTFLLNDTVRENIRYGTPDATMDQVVEAARQAGAHEFILAALEHGYDTVIGPNGNRLSGGQQQRLALARAMLRTPEILILDEATSQVDPHSEQLIQRAIEQSAGRRTTLIITHRFSTLQLADRIMVMDAGTIAALGTHAELRRSCPLFNRLFGGIELKQSA